MHFCSKPRTDGEDIKIQDTCNGNSGENTVLMNAISEVFAGNGQNETAQRHGIAKGDMSKYMKGAYAALNLAAGQSSNASKDSQQRTDANRVAQTGMDAAKSDAPIKGKNKGAWVARAILKDMLGKDYLIEPKLLTPPILHKRPANSYWIYSGAVAAGLYIALILALKVG